MKTIMVTGGAGFIGSHLIDDLMIQGHAVICVDNLYSGSKKNIEQWLGHKRFQFIEHDIRFDFQFFDWSDFDDVDEIYHLACAASPVFYQNKPIETLETNFIGTQNMLELALLANARIIFTSTSEVYGNPDVHPQPETYHGYVNPYGDRSCYDEGKRVAESLMYEYRKKGVNTGIVRIFNTYGPRLHLNDGRVVSNFIRQSMDNVPLSIYGDGSQTRSFCYISDMVKGLQMMMDSTEKGPINLGNPEEKTVHDLALIVSSFFPTQEVHMKKYSISPDDPKQRRPDITKALSTLNWSPSVCLQDGLSMTIDWYKNNPNYFSDC